MPATSNIALREVRVRNFRCLRSVNLRLGRRTVVKSRFHRWIFRRASPPRGLTNQFSLRHSSRNFRVEAPRTTAVLDRLASRAGLKWTPHQLSDAWSKDCVHQLDHGSLNSEGRCPRSMIRGQTSFLSRTAFPEDSSLPVHPAVRRSRPRRWPTHSRVEVIDESTSARPGSTCRTRRSACRWMKSIDQRSSCEGSGYGSAGLLAASPATLFAASSTADTRSPSSPGSDPLDLLVVENILHALADQQIGEGGGSRPSGDRSARGARGPGRTLAYQLSVVLAWLRPVDRCKSTF